MNKKGISLLLVLALAVSLLSGCGGTAADKPAKLKSAGDFNRWFSDGGRSLTNRETPGNYYFLLTGDIALNQVGIIDNGHKVFIDLNGYTITNQEKKIDRAFCVTEGASLILTGGTVEMAGADMDGGLVFVDGGTLELDNVTLTNRDDTGISGDRSGGVLYVTGQDPQQPGVLTVKNGTVINGSAAGTRYAGGAVTLEGCSEMRLLDGTIRDGVAGMSGNVHLGGQAVLYMMGGIISGGQAKKSSGITGDGGNINITAQSRLCLYGGTISGGKAERSGGNIFVSNYGKAEKQGFFQYGGTVEGGYTPTKGGNLYAVDKTSRVCLYGGEVRNGQAAFGGNLYIEAAHLEMRGATLTGLAEDSLNTSGGNIYAVRGNIDLYDGVVTGAWTNGSGGNVYITDSTMQIYGGSITQGQTTTVNVNVGGGNLFAGGSSVVKMYGGRISDGICNRNMEDATTAGPNVMIGGTTRMHMFGGTIADGMLHGTTCRTGCVYIYGQQAGDDAVFHMYGGTLENGELEADVMRGLAVGAYSVLADSSGVGTGRIFDGTINFKGDSDSPNRRYTIFGNKDSAINMFILGEDKYEGLYLRGTKVGPCPDSSHNTLVEILDATCVTPGCAQYHCDTCGDWYEITAPATGHKETANTVAPTETGAGYTEHTCETCGPVRYTEVICK